MRLPLSRLATPGGAMSQALSGCRGLVEHRLAPPGGHRGHLDLGVPIRLQAQLLPAGAPPGNGTGSPGRRGGSGRSLRPGWCRTCTWPAGRPERPPVEPAPPLSRARFTARTLAKLTSASIWASGCFGGKGDGAGQQPSAGGQGKEGARHGRARAMTGVPPISVDSDQGSAGLNVQATAVRCS
jgi:hypothetical protein